MAGYEDSSSADSEIKEREMRLLFTIIHLQYRTTPYPAHAEGLTTQTSVNPERSL